MPHRASAPSQLAANRPEPPSPGLRSLVVPMYQEAGRIGASIEVLARAALPGLEIVLVDDGSTDGTGDAARAAVEAHPELDATVLSLDRNRGKGGAIAAGVARTAGAAVAFADADLSTPPEAIEECLRLVESGDADVVVTTRRTTSSRITAAAPTGRRMGSRLFHGFLGWRLGLDRYSDTQCGLKAFSRDAANRLFRDLSVQRFAFDVEILLRAEVAGLRVTEVPIEWRHVDRSTVRPVRDGARMLLDVMRLRGRVRRWQPDAASARMPVLAVLERRHWWYVSHRDVCTDAVTAHCARPDAARMLAVGSGTGSMVDRFGELGARSRVGLDPSPEAVAHGRGPLEDPADLVTAEVGVLPLADRSAEVVTALDVIAFVDDDVADLAELGRVLEPGGLLVVTAPGLRGMWSDYDVALGHRRRYERSDLRAVISAAGLEPVRVTHFHAWLTPLAAALSHSPLRRFLLQRPEQATFVDARVNRILRALTWLERRVLRHADLPWGHAVLGVARRPSRAPDPAP